MKKTAIILGIIILEISVILGCKQSNEKKQEAIEVTESTEAREKPKTTQGTFVSDAYDKRAEGYDWVGVTIKSLDNEQIDIKVRSRADKKRPTCTYDTKAFKLNDSIYRTYEQGKGILFKFTNDVLTIKPESPEDANLLYFYCSGGATLEGSYKKIDESLDQSQVDKTTFSKVLILQGIGFNVSAIKKGDDHILTVMPFGLENDNSSYDMKIDGDIINAEVEDLNSDGSPEVLVFTQSEGSGSYGNVVGYSVNNRKSMSQFYFPPVSQNETISKGYMGHDEFSIVETYLVQRFPIYKDGDTNSNPTGGIRQITYELKDGEAMRTFKVKDVTEF